MSEQPFKYKPIQPKDVNAILSQVRLSIARDNPTRADAEATKALMNFYQKEDGWHCPRCSQVFTDPQAFAEHIVDEFNKALDSLPRPSTQGPKREET